MTSDIPEQNRDATASVIHYVETTKNIKRLVHDMLHTCKTVEEYIEKLNGLLRIFWGDSTPEDKKLDDVIWIEVMVQILPTECLIPIFKTSVLTIEGKENEDEENQEPCNK